MLMVEYDELEPSEDYLALNYKGQPFTGVAIEHGANDTLLTETNYVDGQKSGAAREWLPTGVLIREQHFASGALHGKAREWHDMGQIRSESEYELGVCLWEKRWAEDGRLTQHFELDIQSPQFAILQRLRLSSIGQMINAERD